jgi:hypothetical protein
LNIRNFTGSGIILHHEELSMTLDLPWEQKFDDSVYCWKEMEFFFIKESTHLSTYIQDSQAAKIPE